MIYIGNNTYDLRTVLALLYIMGYIICLVMLLVWLIRKEGYLNIGNILACLTGSLFWPILAMIFYDDWTKIVKNFIGSPLSKLMKIKVYTTKGYRTKKVLYGEKDETDD